MLLVSNALSVDLGINRTKGKPIFSLMIACGSLPGSESCVQPLSRDDIVTDESVGQHTLLCWPGTHGPQFGEDTVPQDLQEWPQAGLWLLT